MNARSHSSHARKRQDDLEQRRAPCNTGHAYAFHFKYVMMTRHAATMPGYCERTHEKLAHQLETDAIAGPPADVTADRHSDELNKRSTDRTSRQFERRKSVPQSRRVPCPRQRGMAPKIEFRIFQRAATGLPDGSAFARSDILPIASSTARHNGSACNSLGTAFTATPIGDMPGTREIGLIIHKPASESWCRQSIDEATAPLGLTYRPMRALEAMRPSHECRHRPPSLGRLLSKGEGIA